MALTHALSTNNYGPARLIVATSAANGTHTTLAGAMADAVSGDTIFLRDSVTENVTITAGVNITAWSGGSSNTPAITGKLTMTAAGTSTISGVDLITNSDNFLVVSGSAASIVNVNNCYLNCLNATGISFSSSSGSSSINIANCFGNVGTTGIAIFASTAGGTLNIQFSNIANTGSATTACTMAGGTLNIAYSSISSPMAISSSTAGTFQDVRMQLPTNTAVITLSNTAAISFFDGFYSSGSASAFSVGAGTTANIYGSNISSTNTNAITGSGTLVYSAIIFSNTSSLTNVSTQTGNNINTGGISFDAGTNVLSSYTVGTYTPTIVGGSVAGSTTYSLQNGYYTRVGNQVTLYGRTNFTNATGTGNAVFGAFPFTVKNQTNYIPVGSCYTETTAWPASKTSIVFEPTLNTITGVIYGIQTSAGQSIVQMANTTWNTNYTVTYQI